MKPDLPGIDEGGSMDQMDRRAFLKFAALACPLFLRKQAEQKKRLAVISQDDCLGCEVCIDACPVNAISFDEEEEIAKVDPELCTGCGDCVKECPVEAIEVKDVEIKAPAKEFPKKKPGLPQLDSGGGAAVAAAAFDITGLWVITAKFAGDKEPVSANVRFTGTAAQGEMADGDTGEKQGTYTVKDGGVEFIFDTGEIARGKFTTADRMEGTLPDNGTWSAVRKR
jgi:NAD-dependent dihydropyrimidine dehydrogenase PreA subunit